MKSYSFLLVIAIGCLSATITTPESETDMPGSHVYIVNNGQIPLLVNSVLIPIHTHNAKPYPVQVLKKELVVQIPGKKPTFAHIVKLLGCDIGGVIKIGGFYDENNDQYLISTLLTNKVPILFAIQKEIAERRLPRKL